MTQVRRSRISRWRGVWMASMRLSPPSPPRSGHGIGGGAHAVQHGRRVEVGGEQELGHLILHVAAEPAHRRELGPVRLLVQADPAAEIVRVHPQLALHHEDVRRHQGQPARWRGTVGSVRVGGKEQLVLPEHPSRQVGEDEPGLHPGDAGSHRRDHRAGLGRPAPFAEVLSERIEDHPEAVHVRPDPPGAVHHRHPADVLGAEHPGDLVDWFRDGGGEPAQLLDHRSRVGQADLRPGPHPSDAGRDSDVPVDHLSAVHPSTVRAPGDEPGPAGSALSDEPCPAGVAPGDEPCPIGLPAFPGGRAGRVSCVPPPRRRHYERQPQPASLVAIASMTPAAWVSCPGGSRSAMNANASSRPLASLTIPARLTTCVRLPVLACTVPSAAGPKLPNTLWPRASVPEKPATGIPVTAARSAAWRPSPASRTSRASASGEIRSSGERPLPSTRWMPLPTPSRAAVAVTAAAAPANEAGRPVRSATCRARFSAITLLLSRSIQPTIADRYGERTLATVAAPAGAAAGATRPWTRTP